MLEILGRVLRPSNSPPYTSGHSWTLSSNAHPTRNPGSNASSTWNRPRHCCRIRSHLTGQRPIVVPVSPRRVRHGDRGHGSVRSLVRVLLGSLNASTVAVNRTGAIQVAVISAIGAVVGVAAICAAVVHGNDTSAGEVSRVRNHARNGQGWRRKRRRAAKASLVASLVTLRV